MSLDKMLATMLEKQGTGLDDIDDALAEKRGLEEVKTFFSVSQLFYCPRVAFLTRAGIPRIIDPKSGRKMLFGNLLHDMIQDAMKRCLAGYSFVERTLFVPELSISGHIDGAIPPKGQLVEIKTVSSNQASKISKLGMPDYYVKQANLYIYLWNYLSSNKKAKGIFGTHLDNIWFIVLNRDTMDWVPLEPVKQDEELQSSIINDLYSYQKLWGSDDLPPMGTNCQRCSDFKLCKSISMLEDILPGGKVRKKYEQ